jgi:hypothetical protein
VRAPTPPPWRAVLSLTMLAKPFIFYARSIENVSFVVSVHAAYLLM